MNESELEQQGAVFIERHRVQGAPLSAASKAEGAELAARLRTKAVDLCYNKATEFSPAIGRLFELAAKVALLAHWPDEGAMALYEKDVAHVFGDTERSRNHARSYEHFRREYIKAIG